MDGADWERGVIGSAEAAPHESVMLTGEQDHIDKEQPELKEVVQSSQTLLSQERLVSPFGAASMKPLKESRRVQPSNMAQRHKSAKPGSEATNRAGGAVGPSRTKSSNLKAEPAKGGGRGRGPEAGSRPAGLPPKALPHTKSVPHLIAHTKNVPHLQKVSTKSSAAQKAKTGSAFKRSVSWNELHLNVGTPETSFTNQSAASKSQDGSQKPLPSHKRLFQKIQHAGSQVLEKAHAPQQKATAPLRLPVLNPPEKKILASVGQRDWISIDATGEESVFKKDKHLMTSELGMQVRDLRLLDPMMTSTYPSAILFRDKALVVNLEYIKCIITQDSTLILDADQPYVKAFRQQLQQRLRDKVPSYIQYNTPTGDGSSNGSMSFSKPRFDPPYELKALETALDNVCKHLENAYVDLDQSMRPMLGTHTVSKVTSDYLERLRRLKTSLVRLKTRVETLKEVLDKILGDEGDMRAIHLSGRMREQRATIERKLMRQSLRDNPNNSPTLARQSISQAEMVEDENARDVEEVEMLLSPYHLNLDSIWNRLLDIGEFVDDTEELIDLEMDTYRNNNIRMRLGLGTLHLLASMAWAVFNVCGMNLGKGVIKAAVQPNGGNSHKKFLEVCISTIGGSAVLFVLMTWYLHKRRLAWISIPN